ncbi:MAG: invasion associated locus B family protein [Pseudomonadota bacterium]
MISPLRRIAAASLISVLALSGAALAQQGQPKLVKQTTHGDWDIVCVEGTDTCRMEQTGKTDQNEPILAVSIERVSGASINGQAYPSVITMVAPLGTLLPAISAKIDSAEPKLLPFERCLSNGCFARSPMIDETVSSLKKGSKMLVEFRRGRMVSVSISLRGFTKAYNSLKPIPAQ